MTEETVKVLTDPSETSEDVEETPDEDFTYVRTPDGKVRAIRANQIVDTEKQDLPDTADETPEERHFYVHLSNGDVARVAESDLPTPAGQDSPFGYWRKGKSLHPVIGVYPVEHNV